MLLASQTEALPIWFRWRKDAAGQSHTVPPPKGTTDEAWFCWILLHCSPTQETFVDVISLLKVSKSFKREWLYYNKACLEREGNWCNIRDIKGWSEICIYCDAVNDQGSIVKCLHPEGAKKWFPISEPAEDWAGVSVDWTVKHSRATLDDCLRHVGFAFQHWRLWRHNTYL